MRKSAAPANALFSLFVAPDHASASLRRRGLGAAVSMPSEWPVNGVEDKASPNLSPARRSRSSLVNLNGSAKDSSAVNVTPLPCPLVTSPSALCSTLCARMTTASVPLLPCAVKAGFKAAELQH